jgi:hypothetical protein
MKLLKNPSKPVPSGIIKLAAITKERFTLFILLDQIPYMEVKANRLETFNERLREWEKENLPSLCFPVSVRYFMRINKSLDIQEARP